MVSSLRFCVVERSSEPVVECLDLFVKTLPPVMSGMGDSVNGRFGCSDI